jgi:hypothetical protein
MANVGAVSRNHASSWLISTTRTFAGMSARARSQCDADAATVTGSNAAMAAATCTTRESPSRHAAWTAGACLTTIPVRTRAAQERRPFSTCRCAPESPSSSQRGPPTRQASQQLVRPLSTRFAPDEPAPPRAVDAVGRGSNFRLNPREREYDHCVRECAAVCLSASVSVTPCCSLSPADVCGRCSWVFPLVAECDCVCVAHRWS